MTSRKLIYIKNRIAEINIIHDVLNQLKDEWGLDTTVSADIVVALDELLANAIYHAFKRDEHEEIKIEFIREDNIIRIGIEHGGILFDPTRREVKKAASTLDDIEIGGLGILLVKELMDVFEYRVTPEQKNFITLIKHLR
ncbi:MAG: ATP-binding protein [Ignavibacteriaceae bacterium]|nr:ATP-binding protein [Ignavibacteriaceae bacterium]